MGKLFIWIHKVVNKIGFSLVTIDGGRGHIFVDGGIVNVKWRDKMALVRNNKRLVINSNGKFVKKKPELTDSKRYIIIS